MEESEQQEDGRKLSGRIEITNWLDDPAQSKSFSCVRVYPSPVKNYAVVAATECLIAVVITGSAEDLLNAEYVDMLSTDADDDMRCSGFYTVDWSQIENGYANVSGYEMNTGHRQTVCRFYFDAELYTEI